ncbi:cytoplasmic protein [Candidatus Magnetoovum chiemensis]|nr:cytoplasmic protein [Candidatus Magnetoovum chiemensis]
METKSVVINPALEISISCPHCEVKLKINRKSLPKEDFSINCPKCKNIVYFKINKRDFYRKKVAIPIYFEILEKKAGMRRATIVDISKTGLRVEGPKADFLPKLERLGVLLNIWFTLPPNKKINVKGEIVSVDIIEDKRYSLGIMFVNLDEFHEQQLGFFLMP